MAARGGSCHTPHHNLEPARPPRRVPATPPAPVEAAPASELHPRHARRARARPHPAAGCSPAAAKMAAASSPPRLEPSSELRRETRPRASERVGC
ncbi:hypothetical protein DAI22_05g197814 [Oryza sativa Japonica Group]|nr:hypothetical protein DAI22_05g197814 [Oryza sativa Japonica Group]